MFDHLAPTIAISHGEAIAQEIIKPLQDADNDLLREDTEEHRDEIAAMLQRCIDLGQRPVAESQIARLHRMYPKRMKLRRVLGAVLDGSFVAHEANVNVSACQQADDD